MTKNDVLSMVMSLEGAEKCRANKVNFIAIPTDEGVVKVSVGLALAEDTKRYKAFNFEAAKAEYKAWEAENALKEAERASKHARVAGPNPEAEARRQNLDNLIANMPAFTNYTATDIYNALADKLDSKMTLMAVGSAAKRLVEHGVLTLTLDENKKKHYSKG